MHDAELAAEALPGRFTYALSDNGGAQRGDDSFRGSWGVAVAEEDSWTGSGHPSGLVVGGDLTVQQAAYRDGGLYRRAAVHGHAGLGWAVDDRTILVASLLAGPTLATVDLPGNGMFPRFRARGPGWEMGVELAVHLALSEAWQVFANAGYRTSWERLTDDAGDLRLQIGGYCLGIGLGYRLSQHPALLE